ncbi:MAG: hypothetical protein ACJAWC_001642 [Yoonia sp.]|jgi:hypothetical protein
MWDATALGSRQITKIDVAQRLKGGGNQSDKFPKNFNFDDDIIGVWKRGINADGE